MIFPLPKQGAKNYPKLLHPVYDNDKILLILFKILQVKKVPLFNSKVQIHLLMLNLENASNIYDYQ